jgi:hypothetical protein
MIDDADLATLEQQVWDALVAGDTGGLRVLGYGEITLVLGWPADAPEVACKRLPVFPNASRATAYGATIDEYVGTLGQRGVDVLPSEWRTVAAGGGGTAGYVVQPVLASDTLAPRVLRTVPTTGLDVLAGIVDTIANVVDEHVGLDGQVANWALDDGRLRYFDVTTPMLNDAAGHTRMDLDLLVQPLPAPVRPAVRRWVAPGIVAHFGEPRYVMVDLIGNLHKERLDAFIDPAIGLANRYARPPIGRDEVDRFYRSDARTWEALLRLRRADRWWQHHVRRRTYPYLLPGAIER